MSNVFVVIMNAKSCSDYVVTFITYNKHITALQQTHHSSTNKYITTLPTNTSTLPTNTSQLYQQAHHNSTNTGGSPTSSSSTSQFSSAPSSSQNTTNSTYLRPGVITSGAVSFTASTIGVSYRFCNPDYASRLSSSPTNWLYKYLLPTTTLSSSSLKFFCRNTSRSLKLTPSFFAKTTWSHSLHL